MTSSAGNNFAECEDTTGTTKSTSGVLHSLPQGRGATATIRSWPHADLVECACWVLVSVAFAVIAWVAF